MNNKPIRVLLIEDNPGDVRLIREFLSEDNPDQFALIHADRLKTGFERLTEEKPDAILLDLGLPDSQGLDTYTKVYTLVPEVPIVILTGVNDIDQAIKAMKSGAQDYLIKGECSGSLLKRAIRYAIERAHSRKALREDEQQLASIYAAVGDAIFLLEVQSKGSYRFISVNPAFCRITGLRREQIEGKKVTEVIPEPSLTIALEKYRQASEANSVIRWEETSDYPSVRLTGEVSIVPFFTDQGRCTHLVGSVHDLTERKRAEEALTESEKRYRGLFNGIPVGLYRTTPSGKILDFNLAGSRMLGYEDHEEVFDSNANEFWMNPEARKHLPQEVNQDGKYDLEIQFRRCDQKIIWVHNIGRVVRDDQGKILYYEGSLEDITARKQAGENLRESEQRFHSLFENMLNGFTYCRMIFSEERPQDFIYLEVNRAFETLTGLKNVVGKKVTEVIPGIRTTDPNLLEFYGRVALTGIPETSEIYVEALKMWFSISAYSPSKEYFVAVFDVITERKLAEQKLKAYSDNLEEMVESRTRALGEAQEKLVRQEKLAVLGQLAGGVGHELRNPLGVINTSIYYLKMVQPDANEKIIQHLGIITQEINNADKIITDLLDFGRVVTAERGWVSVPDLVQRVLARFPTPPTVQVAFDLPSGLPKVFADPRQVEQVLGNLTTNACQAMVRITAKGVHSTGKLTISAARQKGMVAITIKDTGTGITPENMKHLFEPLFTTKAKGIGLGLAVSRKLAEANGGRIEVESEPRVGSMFTLFLPMKE